MMAINFLTIRIPVAIAPSSQLPFIEPPLPTQFGTPAETMRAFPYPRTGVVAFSCRRSSLHSRVAAQNFRDGGGRCEAVREEAGAIEAEARFGI